MGVIDKFLNAMKMNDDDMLDDDYLDDDYDDEDSYDDESEEDRPKKRILNRFKDDDVDRSESKTAETSPEEPRVQAQMPRQNKTRSVRTNSSSKISPMRTNSTKRSGGMEVCVIKPKNMEDAREVTETLLDECTVILNMEGIDFELAQRIIDFACGSCYAIHGKLQKVSNYIFIITPPNVDISGDFQEIMGNGAYQVPSFGASY